MPWAARAALSAAVGGSPGTAAYDVTTAPAPRPRSPTRRATCRARAASSAARSRAAATLRRRARRADATGGLHRIAGHAGIVGLAP